MIQFNIYLRKDGRWEGRIYYPSEKGAKKTYKSFYGKSREEVALMMIEYNSENSHGDDISISLSPKLEIEKKF